MGIETKKAKKAFLTVLCIIILTAAGIAVLTGVRVHDMKHLTLYGFTAQRTDGTYYADAAGVHSPLLVTSDVDLSPYLTSADTVLNVEGKVTRLRLAHQDVLGNNLPALTFDYRIHTVISSEPGREG